MKKALNWKRIIYIIGVIALIIGAIDPLEGSVIILAGSILMAISTYMTRDRHFMIFISASVLIAFGIFFLFYLSSLGGFGGNSKLSWWWGILILPYPFAWFTTIILLISRAINKPKINYNQ